MEMCTIVNTQTGQEAKCLLDMFVIMGTLSMERMSATAHTIPSLMAYGLAVILSARVRLQKLDFKSQNAFREFSIDVT